MTPSEEAVIQWGTQALLLWERYLAIPGVRPLYELVLFLTSVSGTFWLLCALMGYVALKIHDGLDRSLAVLFAVTYNVVLGLLFASVMFLAIMTEKGHTRSYFFYQAGGFVFVYLVLSSVYADRKGKIDEYGILGFAGGLLAYLAFAVRPDLLGNRLTLTAYGSLQAMKQGLVGQVLAAWVVYQSGIYVAKHGWRALTDLLSPVAALAKRFFFERASNMTLGESL